MKALFEYTKPNPTLDTAFLSLLREEKNGRKFNEDLANIPNTLHAMLASPIFALYIILRYIVDLVIKTNKRGLEQ